VNIAKHYFNVANFSVTKFVCGYETVESALYFKNTKSPISKIFVALNCMCICVCVCVCACAI